MERTIEAISSTQSAALMAQLAAPSASYKKSARLAVAGLLGFVLLYVALAGWFLYTAYRLIFLADSGARNAYLGYGMAACALFFAFFMVKAIFSVRHSTPDGLLELLPQQQPGLFAFLYELADAAGAPRPHKVFLSNRVNAAVFYDLSLFNLILPSKKNLEIGLGLVNVLSLGEVRAVLAHEFGHFAQRSMAVGRWVYVAQQIASHLVSRRDAIDSFLANLALLDLRVRAGVAVLQLIVWSIRSLVESAFSVVVLMQRTLSREMEMQADLVAVSLTGSDALIHALHRLQAADDAWRRTLDFSLNEQSAGRTPRDVYAVQEQLLRHMGDILDDEYYGQAPPLPEQDPQHHRLFKVELGQPPRMWQTHPLNHEREINAKRIYVAAPVDQESAWTLFDAPRGVRERMTELLLGVDKHTAPLEQTLAVLASHYQRGHFERRYCGMYFGRTLSRHVADSRQLYDAQHVVAPQEAALLYPPGLREEVRRLGALEDDAAQLRALIAGVTKAPGGRVQLGGEQLRLQQLPAALLRVQAQIDAVTARLREHDLLCRSHHHAIARQVGGGWDAYLDGLLALLHYAEHGNADVRDAHGSLLNTVRMATAAGHARKADVERIVQQANDLQVMLKRLFQQAGDVRLDAHIKTMLGLGTDDDWRNMLGEFLIPVAARENINYWVANVDQWTAHVCGHLSALRMVALERLLASEALLGQHAGTAAPAEPLPAAPAPSCVANEYARFPHGAERALQLRPGWWARFQRADGFLPGAARLAVAAGIVLAVLCVGSLSGESRLAIYNGLGLPVEVKLDGAAFTLPPYSSLVRDVAPQRRHHIVSRNEQGQLLEEFDTEEVGSFSGAVYNVGGAAVLIESTASYGSAAQVPPRILGAPRWSSTNADILFSRPPEQVSSNSSNTRSVLGGVGELEPEQQLALLNDAAERRRVIGWHARWDDTRQPHTGLWLELAANDPAHAGILAQRLKATPRDVVLLRAQQDLAGPERSAAMCAPYQASAAREPENGDLKYLALRCPADSGDRVRQILSARRTWPDNPWLAYAAAYARMESGDLAAMAAAIPELELVVKTLPPKAEDAAVLLARLQRYTGQSMDLAALTAAAPSLNNMLVLERSPQDAELIKLAGLAQNGAEHVEGDSPALGYSLMARGELDAASKQTLSDDAQSLRLLRMLAGSDGVSSDVIRRALALPQDKGNDPAAHLVSLALAIKAGADTAPYVDTGKVIFGVYQPKVMAFLEQVRRGGNLAAAEASLSAMPLSVRMYVYNAGIILLGDKAPPAWRIASRRMLFASERPYFHS